MDRRQIRTRKMLMRAMIYLMGRAPWDRIEVQQICDQADVARSTFYSHFNNKQELPDCGFAELESKIAAETPGRSLTINGTFSFLPELLGHIQEHQHFFENMKQTVNGSIVFGRFRSIIGKFTRAEIQRARLADQISATATAFICGGMFGVLEDWKTAGCRQPAREVVGEIDQLVAIWLRPHLAGAAKTPVDAG